MEELKTEKKPEKETQKDHVVVSFTSFPGGIAGAGEVVKSLLAGSVLPDKIVLYVTMKEFGDRGLPEDLIKLTEETEIFEIRDYPENLRSYRKLIPALKDFPESIIVTVDDDVIYDKDLLRMLLETHERVPEAIVAHRTKLINPEKPYIQWKKIRHRHCLLRKYHKNPLILPTGVGGVLYPPRALKTEMLEPCLFTKIAPTTDDIWFWAAAVLNDIYVLPVPFGKYKTQDIPKTKEFALKTVNFTEGKDINKETFDTILSLYPDIRGKISKGRHSRWL